MSTFLEHIQYERPDSPKMIKQQLTFETKNLKDVQKKTSTLQGKSGELEEQLAKLQESIVKAKKIQEEKREYLEEKLNEETQRLEGQQRVIDSLQNAVDTTNCSQYQDSIKNLDQERELSVLKSKLEHLRIYKTLILKEFDAQRFRVNESIAIAQARRFIWEDWVDRFDKFCRHMVAQSMSSEQLESARVSMRRDENKSCCRIM